MKLPKSVFKVLAIVIAPLILLSSLGWFIYPMAIESLADPMEDTVNIPEIQSFSYTMAVASFIIGMILLVYGIVGPKVNEADFGSGIAKTFKCPYCSQELSQDSELCVHCSRQIPR